MLLCFSAYMFQTSKTSVFTNNGNGHLFFSILNKTKMPKKNIQMHKLMIYKLASISIADKHFVVRSRTIRLHYRGGYFFICSVFFLFLFVPWNFVVSLFFSAVRCRLGGANMFCIVCVHPSWHVHDFKRLYAQDNF